MDKVPLQFCQPCREGQHGDECLAFVRISGRDYRDFDICECDCLTENEVHQSKMYQ